MRALAKLLLGEASVNHAPVCSDSFLVALAHSPINEKADTIVARCRFVCTRDRNRLLRFRFVLGSRMLADASFLPREVR
jgi:hypothetical protein